MRTKRTQVVLVLAAIVFDVSVRAQSMLPAYADAGWPGATVWRTPGASAILTPRAFLPLVVDQPTRIAVIGDFGLAGPAEAAVAGLVDAWSPTYDVS